MHNHSELEALLRPAVEALSCDLRGVDYLAKSRPPILRVYIERESGIDVDDCAAVSRQVSALLDVEDPIAGNYTLEVSSPGAERPLFQPEQFQMYVGEEVRLRTTQPIDGQRRFTGRLLQVTAEGIELEFELSRKAKRSKQQTPDNYAEDAGSEAGADSAQDIKSAKEGHGFIPFSIIDRANLKPTFDFNASNAESSSE